MNNTTTKINTGAMIRDARKKKGLSQRELGLAFNPPVTTQFISNVERGVTPLPFECVPALALTLEVDRNALAEAALHSTSAFKAYLETVQVPAA